MIRCRICSRTFHSEEELFGHKAHCNKNNLINYTELKNNYLMNVDTMEGKAWEPNEEQYMPTMGEEAEHDPEVNEVGIVPIVVNETYMLFQNFIELVLQLGSNQMAKVRDRSGHFVHGNRNIYIELMLFSSSRTFLSDDDNTKLIELIKSISTLNDKEIPLPSRYICFSSLVFLKFNNLFMPLFICNYAFKHIEK